MTIAKVILMVALFLIGVYIEIKLSEDDDDHT